MAFYGIFLAFYDIFAKKSHKKSSLIFPILSDFFRLLDFSRLLDFPIPQLEFRHIVFFSKQYETIANPFRGKEDFFKVNRQANLQKYWKFTCACQVCAASPQQEAANDALKRNLLAYLAKQKKYEGENLRGNLYLIFTLEVAILGLMRKLEAEMIREMPECLLRCYRCSNLIVQQYNSKASQFSQVWEVGPSV